MDFQRKLAFPRTYENSRVIFYAPLKGRIPSTKERGFFG